MTCIPSIPGFSWNHRTDPYATHQPVLYEAICRTKELTGPIVELGCGLHSTLLIHSIAGNRTVFSVEHDMGWLNKFEYLGTTNRRFIKINSWYEIISHFASDTDISVLFIDQGDWDSRAQCIKFFKNRAELIVVHDADGMQGKPWIKYEDYYKYVKIFVPPDPKPYITGPPTALLSNNTDITTWEINYEDYK
jgi:hypothetical protein